MSSIVNLAAKFTEDLNQLNQKKDAQKNEIQHTKGKWGEALKKKWKNKTMHGQYIRNIDRKLVSEEDTFLWLTKGDLRKSRN
jgi:septation ring formation regulator EzrA